jgi:hypothetical protein
MIKWSRKMRRLLFLLVLCFPLPAISQKKDAEAKPAKLAGVDDYGDSLTADGVWRADNLSQKTELTWNSVVHLECYKAGGRQLIGSESYCMEAMAQIIGEGFPDISVIYFPVKRWDKDIVIAADSPTAAFPVCTWTQITINLREKSIMATDTRKQGDGNEGFKNTCKGVPSVQTFHLMDKVEEIVRRQQRKSQQKTPK